LPEPPYPVVHVGKSDPPLFLAGVLGLPQTAMTKKMSVRAARKRRRFFDNDIILLFVRVADTSVPLFAPL
jgi:hypothetical protein